MQRQKGACLICGEPLVYLKQAEMMKCSFCGKEELESIQDVLGSYHTDFGTVVNGRTNNIKTGASKLDGLVVYPGETISVSEARERLLSGWLL